MQKLLINFTTHRIFFSSSSVLLRHISNTSLGIETSDDTAVGILNDSNIILSDSLASQTLHTDFGGINNNNILSFR